MRRLVIRLSAEKGYRSRIVAFAGGAGESIRAEVIANFAECARQKDLDVAIVDCSADGPHALADALDAIVERPVQGGNRLGARIEIVGIDELERAGFRKALALLAARVDLVVVNPEGLSSRQPADPVLDAVDDIVLVHDPARPRRGALADFVDALLEKQGRLVGMIVMEDDRDGE